MYKQPISFDGDINDLDTDDLINGNNLNAVMSNLSNFAYNSDDDSMSGDSSDASSGNEKQKTSGTTKTPTNTVQTEGKKSKQNKNKNKTEEQEKEKEAKSEEKETPKQREPNTWYRPDGAIPDNLDEHQGVLIYYYDKIHEKHRKLEWYLERARIELEREHLFDEAKWDDISYKVHDMNKKTYKSFITIKQALQLQSNHYANYGPTYGRTVHWEQKYRDRPYHAHPTPTPAPAQTLYHAGMTKEQYYQNLGGARQPSDNQYTNNPQTISQLTNTITQLFAKQNLPPRDHVGTMPAETTGQVTIPAPPNTTVQTRYPNVTQQRYQAPVQNYTQHQADYISQQFQTAGIPVPPQLSQQVQQAPSQANTS